jgi:hypothetical protein
MMGTEKDYWVWLEKFKGFPEDTAFSARFRKSSVEEEKSEFQRADAMLSAYYALAKRGESARSEEGIGKSNWGKVLH